MNSLLPPGSSVLERRLAQACSDISNLDVPLRDLWNPWKCPVKFLPYLAWAFSVDRWDEAWAETVKRKAVSDAFFIHRRKGTLAAIRSAVGPLGRIIGITEWWENNATPGTFELDIGVPESGMTPNMNTEMDRLISDARPVSRHCSINIVQEVPGYLYTGGIIYDGDIITVYPG